MSLKTVHLLFIIAVILLSFGFGTWSLMNYMTPAGVVQDLVLAIAAGLVGLGLMGYEVYFLRKTKNVSFL